MIGRKFTLFAACLAGVFGGYGFPGVVRGEDGSGAFMDPWWGSDGVGLFSFPQDADSYPAAGDASDVPAADDESGVFSGDEATLLGKDGKYVDRYVFSGANAHGSIGFGGGDYPAVDGPWYSLGLGKAAGGIHLAPVGGKEYDGDSKEKAPGVRVIYGAPGIKEGAVRIESAKFIGVSHFTHKNYCQGMRFALYGGGEKTGKDLATNGKLTKDETIDVVHPLPPLPPPPLPPPPPTPPVATTAQIWLWTMPRCGTKRVIPVGGDGVFGHVNELELNLVDNNRPTVTYSGNAAETANYWVNGKTPTGKLVITGNDIGSGVQSFAFTGGNPQSSLSVRVGCDIYHRGASWNVGRPWISQVCPNTYERTQAIAFGSFADGNTKLIGQAKDLAGNTAKPAVLDIWVDHDAPGLTGTFSSPDSLVTNGWEWFSEKELRSAVWKLHASDNRSGVSRVSLLAQKAEGIQQPLVQNVSVCRTPVVGGKQCERTVDKAFALRFLVGKPDGFYRVQAAATDGAGNTTELAKTILFAKDTTPPLPPRNLNFQARTANSGVLSWTAPVDAPVMTYQGKLYEGVGVNDFSYRIVAGRSVSSWKSVPGRTSQTPSPFRDTLQLTGLPNDTDLEIQLRVRDALGNSAPVQTIQTRIPPPTPKPVPTPPVKDPCKTQKKKPKRCTSRKQHKPEKPRCKRSARGGKICRKKKKQSFGIPPQLAACMVVLPTVAQQKAHAALEKREALKVANTIAGRHRTTVPRTPSLVGKAKPTTKPLPPCTYNVFIRGIEISQGPAGETFQGEQTQQKSPVTLVTDNTQNAVSTMFELSQKTEHRTVIDERTGEKLEGNVVEFTKENTYSQAPYMIAEKATIARVYLGGIGPLNFLPTPRAQVVLEGYRANGEGTQQKLGEISSRLSIPRSPTTDIKDLRTDTGSQASIPLPQSWVSAGPTLTLHAKVLPERALRECEGCTDGANEHWLGNIELKQPIPSRNATSEPSTDFPFLIYRLTWQGNPNAPTEEDVKIDTNYLSPLLPLAQTSVKPYIATQEIELSAVDENGKPITKDGTFRTNNDGQWVCDDILMAFNAFTQSREERPEGDLSSPKWPEEKGVPRLRYVGMFHKDVKTDCGGLAGVGNRTSINRANTATVLAHELGHNYGRHHASRAGGSDGSALGRPGFYSYEPWPDNDQGTINGLWFWRPSLVNFETHNGDLRDLIIASPQTDDTGHGDLMSYRNKKQGLTPYEPPALTSPNTWNRITEALNQYTLCAPLQLNCQPPKKNTNPVKEMFPIVQPPLPTYNKPQPQTMKHVKKSAGEPRAEDTVFIKDPTQPRDRLIEARSAVRHDGFRDEIPKAGEPLPWLPMFTEIPPQWSANVELSTPGLTENVRLYGITERYFYRAFDKDGKLVAEREATIDQPGSDFSVTSFTIIASVRFVLPASARKLQLVVREPDGKESVLAHRLASDHPPVLKVVAPVGGERWRNDGTTTRTGGRPEVAWEIDDPDDDGIYMDINVNLYDGSGQSIRMFNNRYARSLSGYVKTSEILPGEDKRIFFVYNDGWYTGSAYGPQFAVDPHPFQPKDVEVREPGVISDRFYGVNFFARAYDPNAYGHPPMGDKNGEFSWYYKRKLISTKQSFNTLQFRCSKEAKLTFLLVVRGLFKQFIVRPVKTTLSPAKIPPELYKTCGIPKKKKHKHKRKKRKRRSPTNKHSSFSPQTKKN